MIRFGPRSFLEHNVIVLGLGAVVLFSIVLTSYIYSDLAQQHAAEALRASRVDRLILEVVSDLVDAETAERGYAVTAEKQYLDPWRTAEGEYNKDLRELRAMAMQVANGTLVPTSAFDRIAALGAHKLELVKANIARVDAGRYDEARLAISSDGAKDVMDAIRAEAKSVRATFADWRNTQAVEMRGNASTLVLLIVIGAGMILALAIGSGIFIMRYMSELDATRRDLIDINADLEGRVKERAESVLRANEELQRYAYIVGHDLRGPLVNIMGFTSELETAAERVTAFLARIGPGVDEAAHADALHAMHEEIPEAITFIRSSMTRMDALIREILKLSRAGRRTLEPELLDLNAVVTECIDAIRQTFADAQALVEVEGRLPSLTSDRSALQQILSNLLDNAAKYLDPSRPGHIVVRARHRRSAIVIDVEDNGRGIAEADHERIFELFRRAGVQDRPGEGIGLAHTRALARRLGGDVTVESDGQTGTTFHVTIARDLRLCMQEL
ncbi:MAG: ATP-binding protein [Ancalomicrobiaceae bacterium]|nr:ATP-binding protein [Ancalomicrobiaceae bacterium]